MADIQEPSIAANRLLDGYVPESELAKARRVAKRTLRHERQRGEGPPWAKVGRDVYYSIDGFREWLRSIEQRPVRAGKGR